MLDAIIGVKGQANGGVYQFGVPRRDPISENGMQIAPAGPMGVATAINFQPTGGGQAAITGDFVLAGEDVNPVIKALRALRTKRAGMVHTPWAVPRSGSTTPA